LANHHPRARALLGIRAYCRARASTLAEAISSLPTDAVPPASSKNRETRQASLDRFERATEVPLLALAVLLVPVLVVPLLTELPEAAVTTLAVLDIAIWAVFALELGVRLYLTPEGKWRFLRREWATVLLVVVPFLRPLRVLQLLRLTAVLGVVGREARRIFLHHNLHFIILLTALLVFGAAGLALAVEQNAGGSIDSFGDALWWATTTITTVGYGDTYPVTSSGRVVAAVLMVAGIAFFGVVTANLATYFLERSKEEDQAEEVDRLDEILRRLETIERRLEDRD